MPSALRTAPCAPRSPLPALASPRRRPARQRPAIRVLGQARVRLLVPLDHLLRLLLPHGLVRVVPNLEGLDALLFGLVNAEEVSGVEGVDCDGPVKLARGAPDERLLPRIRPWDLGQLREELVVQRRQLLARELGQRLPQILRHVGLGAARVRHLLEEVLEVLYALLDVLCGLVITI